MTGAAIEATGKGAEAAETERPLTDGFHLVIEALKLNGIDTIYGVAGIPITDLARLWQSEGLRYFGFTPADRLVRPSPATDIRVTEKNDPKEKLTFLT